jgi:16S rRNA (guanine527-N7)-methyltransferase
LRNREFARHFEDALIEGAAELGIAWVSDWLPKFLALADEILAWNERAGLTTITDPAEMARKHFLDSLTCLLSPAWKSPASAVDVGSGAGFPGLVLAVAAPECRFVLVESSARRAAFLRHASGVLGIEVALVQQRAEEYGRARGGEGRGRFQLGFSRAAAKLAVSLEYVLPLLARDGSFVAQLGPADGEALAGSGGPAKARSPAWETLGGRLTDLRHLNLPAGAGARWLAQFVKYRETPPGYPRRAGIPSRRPLPIPGG